MSAVIRTLMDMRQKDLSEEQSAALKPFVEGKVIHDLGCGFMQLSRELLELGAAHVIAIDKEASFRRYTPRTGVTFERKYFKEVTPSYDMNIFLGRPFNGVLPGLLELVVAAKQVVYFGCNRNMNQCGSPNLFKLFLFRELLCYVQGVNNSLIVLGGYLEEDLPREPTLEEKAGIDVANHYD